MNKKLILIVAALCLMLPLVFSEFSQDGDSIISRNNGDCIYFDNFNHLSNVCLGTHGYTTSLVNINNYCGVGTNSSSIDPLTYNNWTGSSNIALAPSAFVSNYVYTNLNYSSSTPSIGNGFVELPNQEFIFRVRTYNSQEGNVDQNFLFLSDDYFNSQGLGFSSTQTDYYTYRMLHNSTIYRSSPSPQYIDIGIKFNPVTGKLTYLNFTGINSYNEIGSDTDLSIDIGNITRFVSLRYGFGWYDRSTDFVAIYRNDINSCFYDDENLIDDGFIDEDTGNAIGDYGNCSNPNIPIYEQGWFYYHRNLYLDKTIKCANGEICSNISEDTALYRSVQCSEEDVISYTFGMNLTTINNASFQWSDDDVWLHFKGGNISVSQQNGSDYYLKTLCSNCFNYSVPYTYTIQKFYAPNAYSRYYDNGIFKESSFPSFRLIQSSVVKSDERYQGSVIAQNINFTNLYPKYDCRATTTLWQSLAGTKFCLDDYVQYRGFNPSENETDYQNQIDPDPISDIDSDRNCAIRSSFAGIVIQDCGNGGYERNPAYYDKSNSVYFEWDERCTAQGYSASDWIPCPVKLFVYDALSAVYGWIIGFTIIALVAILLIALFTNFGRK